MKKFRWQWIALAVTVAVIILCGMRFLTPTLPADILLTVDGHPVSEAELLFYMQDEKALAADYFARTYGADVSAGDIFWAQEFDGQTPMDYVKQTALDRLVREKQTQLLYDERGIAEYKTFDELSEDLAVENEKRAAMEENGEIFYGLSEFDLYQYIGYVYDGHWPELVATQLEMTDIPDAELLALYEAAPENYTFLPDELKATISVTGEPQEERILDRRNISKEDVESQQFWDQLAASTPGEIVTGVYEGEFVAGTLTEKPESTIQPFEAVRENLLYSNAEESLRALIAQRADSAKIIYNHATYDSLTWQ
jgi:hypothetical protein